MKTRIPIQNELKELNSSLPPEKGPEIYSVPEGYFENFAASVLSRIRKEQDSVQEELKSISPVLAGIPRKMPFSVPENYFHQTTEGLPGLVQEDPLPRSLMLAGKEMPYRVPDGYFDQFSATVLSKVSSPQGAKVIPMKAVRWIRYAAAAAIVGFIALGSVLYFGTNKSGIDPVSQPGQWVAAKLKNISNRELEEFIKNTDSKSVTGTETAVNRPSDNPEVRKLLKDVPDQELDRFLSEVPGDNEEFPLIN